MPDTPTPPASPILSLSGALRHAVAAAAPSVVAVHSHRARSSGFVWRPGLVVTADEALAEEGDVAVTAQGGRRLGATLVGRDPSTDVALLRIDDDALPAAALAPEPVAAGSLALALGSQDGAPLAALGLVALAGPAWRSMRGGEIDARIELDLALRRRAEGGLALDAAGQALGMTVFGPRRRVLVIPGATVARVAEKLLAHGRIPRGYLGLGLQPVRRDDGGAGLMVMSVEPGGPGAAAGLRQGDVVAAIDGEPVAGLQALQRALGPGSVGTPVRLTLRRAGEAVEAALTIGERPHP
ncbi:Putative serine protease HtrA [Methylobacterium crusticola]|uniref:Serine protease HtrA n=1 Tax=Methylobacterium crusticola TaxID=1697972 RepID=A0ABQ4QXJ3_9HYPH|nr:S1C family serine protease [Methylobacterium crusticola]GJD50086.1 Putative serine protease HtrA [Methylobacterium crusticola]